MQGAMRTLPDWLVERLATAPRKPGCYLMKDRVGEIVYVGKAQDLKARLGQYFAPVPGDTRFFVGLLDQVLGEIELIVANSVKEALLLENELIKRHQPRFNVKLKDDKNFLTIRVGKEHAWPRLEVVRRRNKDDADYFGPYHSATSIRNTLRVINRHFQLRTCRDSDFRNRARPCLEHQIGRCPAPCVLAVPPESYQESLADVKLFLAGRGERLLRRINEKMKAASEALEFELAARYRDQIQAIERSLAPQSVLLSDDADIDALGLYREGAELVVQTLHLRSGVIVGSRGYRMTKTELPDDEVIDGFLAAFYDGTRPVPDLVLTPLGLAEAETWGELLSEVRGRRCELRHPQRGDKRRLLDMANENARTTFDEKKRDRDDALETLGRLQQKLGLRELPRRIECYDISNIQGTNPVGSMVVATDGVMDKKAYRHFKIRGEARPNDYAMMLEVLSRRFRNASSEEDGEAYPELLLIDGGKGQLNIAVAVLEALGIEDIELASLAKSRVLDEEGHVARDSRERPSSDDIDRSPERVFRPGRKNPVVLRANSNELFLLQRLRDEAHRFAITFHKKLRAKRTLTSELDAIPGVGPARRRELLRHFGSLKQVREADVEALLGCPGISRPLAERIAATLLAPGY
ncbi:MAG: excinuclease ABC subunit C [Deltaproteobacteria bacterium HGW-Deltaproteobacteria-14]|jgi:excinuclease ABC subunit C|nr:MAG: excinuclease ABC subunit C [Deltaproteobacteria bacterium HGW-Deltaproteobacteria-14]